MELQPWPDDWLKYEDSGDFRLDSIRKPILQFPIPDELRNFSFSNIPHGVAIIQLEQKYSGLLVYGYLHTYPNGEPRREWIANYGERIAIRILLEQLGFYPKEGE